MDFFQTVKKRQSIRNFHSTPVDAKKLVRILEAANRAPSAGNLQAYRIVVVKQSSVRQKLSRAAGHEQFVAEAPVVLVFCAEPARSSQNFGARGEQLLCIQDATVACAYAQLAATASGLASIWLGATIEPEAIRKILSLSADLWPIALLPVGYPAETPPRKPRRPLEDLVEEA